jgi:hypothetical protein
LGVFAHDESKNFGQIEISVILGSWRWHSSSV